MPEEGGVTSRTVPLNATATAILQKYLFARFGSGPRVLEEPLFPSRFHGKRINCCRANVIVHEVLKKAGFENQEAYAVGHRAFGARSRPQVGGVAAQKAAR